MRRSRISGHVEQICDFVTTQWTTDRRLIQGAEKLQCILDDLDRRASQKSPQDYRRTNRYPFREMELLVEIEQHAGSWVRYRVTSRNLSKGGIGILVGHYVYVGRRCVVHLPTRDGELHAVPGNIVRCRYLQQTGTVYEIGVQFDEQIEIGLYHTAFDKLRMLLVDSEAETIAAMARFSKRMNLAVTAARDAYQAVEAALTRRFDFMLLDTDLPKISGLVVVHALRQRGLTMPMIVATYPPEPGTLDKCLRIGCNALYEKPLQRNDLAAIVRAVSTEPQISTMGSDPDIAELVDIFVENLPETLRKMETCYLAGDTQGLLKLVRRIKGEGSAYGFDRICRAAKTLEDYIEGEVPLPVIREGMTELYKYCFAVQPIGGAAVP